MPETQLRSLEYEPYEFTYESREISESSDWNDLIQFGLRKIERFVKSHVIELQIPEELTDGGRYNVEARFIDEISDELDVIEDKKAPLLCEFNGFNVFHWRSSIFYQNLELKFIRRKTLTDLHV